MKSLLHKNLVLSGVTLLFSLAVLIASGVAFDTARAAEETSKSGERLLTIHDGDGSRGLLTRATNLRQALKEGNITIDSNDLVEPSLDETLIANNYDVNIYRARPVVVVDGDIRRKIMSAFRTPDQIIAHADMTLQDEDVTTLSLSDNIASEGAAIQLTITRATPFSLVLYGQKITAYTLARTVGEMLQSKNIVVSGNDSLSVSDTEIITAGMTIELWRNGRQVISKNEDIPFGIQKTQDMDREIGYREIKMAGIVGQKTVTYEVEMKNGQELSRKEIQSVTTKQPVMQLEIVGAKMPTSFSDNFAQALARLRSCEGNYTSNTGNGYYGAYQFDIATWGGYMGYPNAAVAPPQVQDQKTWETYLRRGWQPWPSCSLKLGLQDIYR